MNIDKAHSEILKDLRNQQIERTFNLAIRSKSKELLLIAFKEIREASISDQDLDKILDVAESVQVHPDGSCLYFCLNDGTYIEFEL
jgi:hypothetical protein